VPTAVFEGIKFIGRYVENDKKILEAFLAVYDINMNNREIVEKVDNLRKFVNG